MYGLKARLGADEPSIGSLVTVPSPDVAEVLAQVGFDYLWIDTEHAPMDLVQAQTLIQAVGGRCPCLVRVPSAAEVWIKKVLDIGCSGIIVPQVRSASEAQQIVAWCLYPPDGERSIGITRAHGYGMTFREYVGRVNEELVIVIQVEHRGAVDEIDAIAAVRGVDAVMVGPFDLSGSLGVLGDTDHPRVNEAVDRVRRSCQAAGVPVGIFAEDVGRAKQYLEEGFSLIALGMDVLFLWRSAQAALDGARERPSEGGG